MFPLITAVVRGGAALLFSGAAFVTSINFFKKKQPAPSGNISAFEIGKLLIGAAGVFLAYKLAREVLG